MGIGTNNAIRSRSRARDMRIRQAAVRRGPDPTSQDQLERVLAAVRDGRKALRGVAITNRMRRASEDCVVDAVGRLLEEGYSVAGIGYLLGLTRATTRRYAALAAPSTGAGTGDLSTADALSVAPTGATPDGEGVHVVAEGGEG